MEQEVRKFWDTYWCGCGDPESAADSFREIMGMFQKDEESIRLNFEKYKAYEEKHGRGLTYCILYWLDGMGLTEHGGSVCGSWLTELGAYVWEQVMTAPAGELNSRRYS